MSDLDPGAIAHLYPVLKILAAAAGFVVVIIGGFWGGFVWLEGRIERVAQAMVSPVAERALHAERSARRANQRVTKLRFELSMAPDLHADDELETLP